MPDRSLVPRQRLQGLDALSRPKALVASGLAAKDYAVQSIPSNFLIDAQGRIVAKNLRGEDLCSKVAELLAE